jgi:regulatory protein
MIITDISSQRNKNRVNIYIDNKFAFGLTRDLLYKFDLCINQELEESFIENILKAEEQSKVTNAALNLISYRQRSIKEIYEKLKGKGYDEDFINKSIEYCKEQNYLNDHQFAESFIRDKQNLNKFGSTRIRYELIKKGVSKDIIEETLNFDKDEEYNVALTLAQKKINSYKGQERNSIYRKLGGFLQRKGYPYDIVTKVLKELLEGE